MPAIGMPGPARENVGAIAAPRVLEPPAEQLSVELLCRRHVLRHQIAPDEPPGLHGIRGGQTRRRLRSADRAGGGERGDGGERSGD